MTNPTELLADRLAAGSALYDPQDRKLAVAALRAFVSPPSDVDTAKIERDSANRIVALRHTPPSDVGGRSDMAMLADDVVREMYSVLPTQWDRDCLRAKVLYALRQSTPSPNEQKLGSSEPLGPLYDGTTMDNQQLHGTTRRNQPVVTAGETATTPSPGQQDEREAIAGDAKNMVSQKEFEIVRTASRLFEDAANTWMGRALKAEALLSRSPAPAPPKATP